ncbi:MAG: 1,4-beta cellobiohydrolase, partial [Thermoleophilia bacterium]|nr:1,4-beta cellobiohydrolase [Thermoleophilia bacterium]
MLTFSTAPTRIFLIALFLIGTIFAALPASGLAHDGHIHDEEAAALQAAFDEELTEAPREVRGECVDTVEFEDLGDGCRTASGLLRLELADGTSMTTHGPDFESPTSATAATMPPRMVAAIRTASADDIFCAPVGTFRFQLTYAIPADGIDDYAVGAERLRRSTYELSAVLDNESRSLTPTASRKLRVACGVDGIPSVLRLRLPTRTTEATVNNAFPEILAGAGDARGTGRTHYLTYYDDHLGDFGGIADMYLDARPSSSNNNLSGGMVAVMDNSEGYGVEWKTLLHEAIHTMGGVQNSAPDASGASHCVDGIDVMCYNDGGPNAHLFNTDQCPQMQVDCGHDSYFHPTPDTPWLQDNWNVAAPANGYLQGATVTGDVTAPSVPTGLAATGSFGLFVRLAWNPSTDAGSGTYGYRVYRSTGAGAWTILGDTWPGSVTYDAATLGYGVNYDFAVAAYDARGNESEKAVVLANSGGPTGVPRVTDGPAPAPATDLVVTGRTADSISLSWNRSGAGSTHTARVCRSGDTFFCPAAMRSFTWAGLPAGSLETFSVQTFDSDGRASVAATVTARTLGGADVIPPTAPTIVTVDPSSDPMSPILSWSGAGGDTHDYAIYHESAPGTWDMGNVQHTNLTTLAVRGMLYLAGTQRVGVAAVDEAGNHSAITSVDHLTVAQRDRTSPSAPTSISISDKTPTSFTASWSA